MQDEGGTIPEDERGDNTPEGGGILQTPYPLEFPKQNLAKKKKNF